LDEEDGCPPDLEAVEVQVQQQQQQQQQQVQQQVQQQQQQSVENTLNQQEQLKKFLDSDLIRNLTIAIKAGMENYQGMESYEPSADELINVLKNLENLAALNPALYRAIVDQINVNQADEIPMAQPQPPMVEEQYHQNGQDIIESEVQQGYSEVDQEQLVVQEQVQEEQVVQMNGTHEVSETDRAVPAKSQEEMLKEQKAAMIQAQVDAEHEEQMRLLKEKKRREKEPPPPPKTITVMAGGRNRPSWPIAPGIANANQPRVITLNSAEDEEEMLKNRFEVAQAAGLKHVDVIHGDENFYPTPMKDYDYPWSGSLRPVSNKMHRGQRMGAPDDMGPSPWAGSLRHVDKNKMRKKKEKKIDDDDMYGSAPWMGTLRHVKHENKVFESVKPRFKKYPDEDAPNPFEGTQGKDAKPVYPLTPAAVIPAGGSSSVARKERMHFEEVERITANLRETRTVSGALLQSLMPKLLKEHESKYEPLGHDESFKIMEEILSMQIGIDTEGKVEDNDEAEQMIRAITHGEIDNAVYSKMADDLETAAQMKRKAEKGKKKKKKKTAGGSTSSKSGLETSASESVVESAA